MRQAARKVVSSDSSDNGTSSSPMLSTPAKVPTKKGAKYTAASSIKKESDSEGSSSDDAFAVIKQSGLGAVVGKAGKVRPAKKKKEAPVKKFTEDKKDSPTPD